MRGFSEIVYVKDMGRPTPASVDRSTGILYINLKIWETIRDFDHRMFILLHELGHLVLDTSDEIAVDAWAFDQYADAGYSLTKSVTALSSLLTEGDTNHYERTYRQLERAKEYDAKNNKSSTMKSSMNVLERKANSGQTNDFLGIGEAAGGLFNSVTSLVTGNKDRRTNEKLSKDQIEIARINAEAAKNALDAQIVAAKAKGAGVGSDTWIWVGAGAAVLVIIVIVIVFLKK